MITDLLWSDNPGAARTRGHRFDPLTALPVKERQWRRLSAPKPLISPAHQGEEAWVEVDSLIGQSVFEPIRRGLVADLFEDAGGGKPLEAIGQRGARNPELSLEVLKPSDAKERLANDQKGPGVGQNLQGAGDGTISPCHCEA